MAVNFLNFNESKAEVQIFELNGACNVPPIDLRFLDLSVTDTIKNVGVIMDKDFKPDKQVNFAVKSSFFQLRLLSEVRSSLSFSDFEQVLPAFITSRLD